MRDFLDRARFYEVVAPERCFLSLIDAVQWAETLCLKDRKKRDEADEMTGEEGDHKKVPIPSVSGRVKGLLVNVPRYGHA